MHMLTRQNIPGGNADGLTVLIYDVSCGNAGYSHFVINGDMVYSFQSLTADGNGISGGNGAAAGYYIINGRTMNYVAYNHKILLSLSGFCFFYSMGKTELSMKDWVFIVIS
jgi:hypothetical protein